MDAVASPYLYIAAARDPRGLLVPHGPMAAARSAGKMWILEDDTRTSLTPPGTALRFCNDSRDDANVLRRNM